MFKLNLNFKSAEADLSASAFLIMQIKKTAFRSAVFLGEGILLWG